MKRLNVVVKPGSKKPGIEKDGDMWIVRVRERPVDNQANVAVIEAIAKEFGVPKSRVSIVRGESSRIKTVLIQVS
ncbi:MAG: DUF167 domain-containing protein [Spirochaetia bacterium]|nr:DUF167 domain-containing protein [Spirochaetia bacterium]